MKQLRVVSTCCAAWLLLLAFCASPASAFTDVPDSHRYASAINELAQLGIVSGRVGGTFGPDDPVYRAQFAKMICGLLQIEVTEDQSFEPFVDLGPDAPGDLYPHEFVGAAYRAAITKGTTRNTFGPYLPVTLAQVVTMVLRAADAFHPGSLASPPPDWYGCWNASDAVHGANVRRADYTDLLAFLPTETRWTGIYRPAHRGEVCQILANLRHRLTDAPPSVFVEGVRLDLTSPLYVDNNRYYLPLRETVSLLDGSLTVADNLVNFVVHDVSVTINTATGDYTAPGRARHMRQPPKRIDGKLYVSLFDLHAMLDLEVVWHEADNSIGLFFQRDQIVQPVQPARGRPALMRFEDITAGGRYSTAESLAKLRVVFDYCSARNIPMHLGWVPRYIDPANGIDNAPAEDYSMHNADFIYTLDYFLDKRGLIGLHGYTHQSGTQVSIAGVEFDGTHNTSESSVRRRVQYALDDANRLGIPISFFESPHYAAVYAQQRIFGEYFRVLYEPKISTSETRVSRITVGGRVVTFVPTPLGYMVGPGDEYNMIARMRSLRDGDLASFFYHPDIEFHFIRIEPEDDGYPRSEYSDLSPLHRVVDAFIAGGYRFVDVNAL